METYLIMKKKNCKDLILERLSGTNLKLAVHEFKIFTYSENNIATRLSELAKEGKIAGKYRKGQSFKEWYLVKQEPEKLLFKVEQTGQIVFI